MDAYHANVDAIIASIYRSTMLNIERRKRELLENGFNTKVSNEVVAKKLAYEFIEENLPRIMKEFSES